MMLLNVSFFRIFRGSMLRLIVDAYRRTPRLLEAFVGSAPASAMGTTSNNELSPTHWSWGEVCALLRTLFLPTLPGRPPPFCPDWLRSVMYGKTSQILLDDRCARTSEAWVYVNGIMSNRAVVELNRARARELFQRPIDVVHNQTDSLVMDLVECWVGKTTDYLTTPAYLLVQYLLPRLLDPSIDRIVLIAHSQGTIIVAQALEALRAWGVGACTVDYVRKLEVYALANCASTMRFLVTPAENGNSEGPNAPGHWPYIESLANEHDFVPKLGCTARPPARNVAGVRLAGDLHVAMGRGGHLCNAHYLTLDFPHWFPASRLATRTPNKGTL